MDTLYEGLYVFLYKSVAHYIFIVLKNVLNWICRENEICFIFGALFHKSYFGCQIDESGIPVSEF